MFAEHIFYITFSLQFYAILTVHPCELNTSCKDCIKDINVCVWCAKNDFNGTRCRLPTSDGNKWCPELLQNPQNWKERSSDNPFNSSPGHVVQIRPQGYKMKLRPGKPLEFSFSFRGAKYYPVDLYFLLDASHTMAEVKSETATQSKNIYEAMIEMTKDVTLGLGTFVDKRLYPFARTFNSEETYSYKHRLKLTENFTIFQEKVASYPYGVNRDGPEAGLDALAQAMACDEIVGWRNESRKIIVFMTNGDYHFAGDGKSAGLFQPYDGRCHITNNTYSNELIMDYPSVGMINKLASERDIIIIFLVDSNVGSKYFALSKAVRGSSTATYESKPTPRKKKSSIVNILKDVYKKITKKIKLKVSNESGKRKDYEITFTPNCTTGRTGRACNVISEKEQHFDATIKLLQYTNNTLPNNIIDISVEGFSEKLTLDVEFIKKCDCERKFDTNSSFCHWNVQQCGICNCGQNRYGKRCECKRNGENPAVNANSTCIANNSTNLCSGRGSCICGTCKCRDGFEGNYCECNKHSCKLGENSEPCNGLTHGKCECGKCICTDGWTGDACQCTTSTAGCEVTRRNKNNTCNNNGICVCGACKCNAIAYWDVRSDHDAHCKMQPCTDCHDLQCSGLKKCVMCKSQDEECSLDQCPESINTSLIQILPEDYLNSTEWKLCKDIRVKVGCYTRFVYRYNDEGYGVQIVVQEKLNCDENYLIYGGICLGTLLLVGLCTLVGWKLLTEARDRREFEDFKKKHGDGMSEHCNPLYAPPCTNVRNPLFRQPSVDHQTS